MKKFINRTIIFILLLIGSMGSIAIEANYKNNLLNVELGQTPDNKVSVLLVFEKPYSDPIKVSYKSENEYQILLPETYHSVTSVSAVNALNVRSANVKLVPYFNEGKSNGYTKIVINTTRPVIFNAHASSVTPEKVAKNDLVEKLEKETTKKVSTPAKTQTKSQKTTKPAVKQEKPAQKETPKIAKAELKKEIKPVPKAEPKKEINQPQKQEQKTEVQQKKQEAIVETKQEQSKNQIKEVEPQINEVEKAENVENKNLPEENTEITEPETVAAVTNPVVPQKQPSRFKTLADSENSTLIVLIISSFALMLLLLKAFNKKTDKYTKRYNMFTKEHKVENKPNIPKSAPKISWQEKYRNMKAQEEANIAAQVQKQQREVSDNLDNIFESSAAVSSPIQETQNTVPPVINYQTPAKEPPNLYTETVENTENHPEPDENIEAFNTLSSNVEFMEEPEPIYNEPEAEPQQEEQLIFGNHPIEEDSVVDIKDIASDNFDLPEMPYGGEDLEILDLDEDISEAETYTQPIPNEPVFDFSEAETDKTTEFDFKNNVNPESENISEISEPEPAFGESPQIYIPEENIQPEPIVYQEPLFELHEEELHTYEEPVNEPELSETIYTEQESPTKEIFTTNPIEPTLINQAKISKTKGFYLIKYGNETSLIGYIKDDVFLINTFKGTSPQFVQTRLTEKKRGADIYLVRSGDYKALVQIGKDEIKKLITL